MDILGIGTDIAECLRIARMIERHGELFVDRVYTPEEIRYCRDRKQSTQHFAARWAAKVAVLKALGTGWIRGIGWRDVEVMTAPNGRSAVLLHGNVEARAKRLGVVEVLVTVAHCRTHATASAVALGKERTS